jgi:hypothetical protein
MGLLLLIQEKNAESVFEKKKRWPPRRGADIAI